MAEAYTFAEEIEKLEALGKEAEENLVKYCQFLKSPEYIKDDLTYLEIFLNFRIKMISTVESAVVPSLASAWATQFQELMKQKSEEEKRQGETQLTLESFAETFSLPKALVALGGIVVSGVVVERGLLPPLALLFVIGACLAFAFAPQLKTLFEGLSRPKEEKEEISAEKLGDWVSDTLTRMHLRYVSARFLLKVQKIPDEMAKRFKELGMDEALVNRDRYIRETLPHELSDMACKVYEECKKALWARKTLLVNAIVQSSQAQFMQRA